MYGSSTIGGKKSTVMTAARSLEILYTAASSFVDVPTRRLGCDMSGSCRSTCDRSLGLSLDAQPAHEARLVSFISSWECFTDISTPRKSNYFVTVWGGCS